MDPRADHPDRAGSAKFADTVKATESGPIHLTIGMKHCLRSGGAVRLPDSLSHRSVRNLTSSDELVQPRQKRDQFALTVSAGLGENRLQLIAHGFACDADRLGRLFRRNATRHQSGQPRFGGRDIK